MANGRAIASMVLTFGIVTVPVKVYTATGAHDVAFRQVHKDDGGRVSFRRFCSIDNAEVPFADIAKGYEHQTGEITILTEDDFADLPLPTKNVINIDKFVKPEEIDPLLHEKSYYLLPDKPAASTYALVAAGIAASGKVGITKVAIRQRESLAVVRADGDRLILDLLFWPDEVREATPPKVDNLNPALVAQAAKFIDVMSGDFDPDDYHDTYNDALNAVIEAKTGGTVLAKPETEQAPAQPVMSLEDMLAASIEAAEAANA